jgi:hypothetical protein
VTPPINPVAASWDREYAEGRYSSEPPLAFTEDILAAARALGLNHGIYIGCGNGRNYLPLVAGGLDLLGIDISSVAIQQLRQRCPERADRLICGQLESLPAGEVYGLVLGIQVFQHGDRSSAHRLIRAAQARVAIGGLMAVRVNAVRTDVTLEHSLIEASADGGFTVQYQQGPKQGLAIHFYADQELEALFQGDFEPILGPRLVATQRTPPDTGQWSQWEGIWHRRG